MPFDVGSGSHLMIRGMQGHTQVSGSCFRNRQKFSKHTDDELVSPKACQNHIVGHLPGGERGTSAKNVLFDVYLKQVTLLPLPYH